MTVITPTIAIARAPTNLWRAAVASAAIISKAIVVIFQLSNIQSVTRTRTIQSTLVTTIPVEANGKQISRDRQAGTVAEREEGH